MKEQGFSLVELLVAMAISGTLMLGAAKLLPLLQIQNLQILAGFQLREELQQIMLTLEKAVRRAGYCNGQCGGEGLYIDAATGSCMLIKWDENSNGKWEGIDHYESEFYGYRIRNASMEMQRGVSRCEGAGWERISDPGFVVITQFTVRREKRLIKLRLAGYAVAFPSQRITIEHWVSGINLR
ncbi:hypothetical protein ED28_12005 [[Pantoea] beijingensis]|uniref:Prepilin peptidase dependent protein B n=1 Tax=[Pantoea] beijingensis TaxID=1324864 RepID=A0A443IBV0_9GAMM|nr:MULTISPECIES: prepilin peptidase-dependent protein [Erwiniaceae]RWR01741.1 hypothetical protein ED28_12005 [[Pantoea] beijingensis]